VVELPAETDVNMEPDREPLAGQRLGFKADGGLFLATNQLLMTCILNSH